MLDAPSLAHVSLSTKVVALAPHGTLGRYLAIAAAVVIVVLAVRTLLAEQRWSRRLTLLALRLGVVAGALVLFFEPALRKEQESRVPNHVAILVDDSQSMSVRESAASKPRWERAQQFLQLSKPAFEKLRQGSRLDFYRFSDVLSPTGEAELLAGTAEGQSTKLGEALQALRARYEGRDLGAVVVVSDGADLGRLRSRPGELPKEEADFLQRLDVPIHTVILGDEPLRDVSIADVRADRFAFVRSQFSIEARLHVEGAQAAGWAGRALSVTLLADGETVQSFDVYLDGKREDYPIKFQVLPERVGKFVYELRAPLLQGEAVAENNRKTILLQVIRDKIRALQVCGRPSYDERFLRSLLKHDPNVDLISFFILRTPNDIDAVAPNEMSLIPFPTDELFREQLRSFDVVFLQNFDYGPYGIGIYLDEIRRYVEEGGGLAMIGGDLSFSSGGYDGTAVETILPVTLLPRDTVPLVDAASFRLQLTDEGRRHPLTALELDVERNLARWQKLPELNGTNLVGAAHKDAVVLGVHPTRKASGQPLPALAIREPGKGRTLSLTSDGTWRWAFASLEDPIGTARAYQRFWQNAIRWLIHDPTLSFLRLRTDRSEYDPRQPITIELKAVAADYQPLRNLEVEIEVTRVGERAPLEKRTHTTDPEGEVRVTLPGPAPGGYRVVGRTTLEKRQVEESETFLVRALGRELESPRGDAAFLQRVAAATGGHHQVSDRALGELVAHPPRSQRLAIDEDRPVWNQAWVFLLTVGCLVGEWLLRRKWGFA